MLNLFANVLILASRLPSRDARLNAERDRRHEDEEWLTQRRAMRFHDVQR